MTVKIQMNSTQEILMKRNLGKNGLAQQLFTKTCAKEMNSFVPFKRGILKDIKVEINKDNIIYYAPYAEKQYYTNRGLGKEGTSLGGLRGKMWDKRMWTSKGNGIVKSISDLVGGRIE